MLQHNIWSIYVPWPANNDPFYYNFSTSLLKLLLFPVSLTPERTESKTPWNAYPGSGPRLLSGPLAPSCEFMKVVNILAKCTSDIFLSLKKFFSFSFRKNKFLRGELQLNGILSFISNLKWCSQALPMPSPRRIRLRSSFAEASEDSFGRAGWLLISYKLYHIRPR